MLAENTGHESPEIWQLPWNEFSVIFGHCNALQLKQLSFTTLEEAENFIKYCGFSSKNTECCRQMERLFGEAVYLIRHMLFSSQERAIFRVPKDFDHTPSWAQLALIASQDKPHLRYKRLWACAVLKVIFTLVNVEMNGKMTFMHKARDLIFDRIKKHLTPCDKNTWLFKVGDISLSVVNIEWKDAKTRHSIALKLLHKPDTTIEEVYDYLGVRIVIESVQQAPLLLKALMNIGIILPHQVIGSRTRNSLISLEKGHSLLEFLFGLYETQSISHSEWSHLIKQIPWTMTSAAEQHKKTNAFTSTHYRALQITIRHLIRAPRPETVLMKALASQLEHYMGHKGSGIYSWLNEAENMDKAEYFPFEIQILDAPSNRIAKEGQASHEHYKAQQLQAVRRNLLADILCIDEFFLQSQDY